MELDPIDVARKFTERWIAPLLDESECDGVGRPCRFKYEYERGVLDALIGGSANDNPYNLFDDGGESVSRWRWRMGYEEAIKALT